MNTQHIYTCKGRQRSITVAAYGETIEFSLTSAPAGSVVEMTDSPIEIVQAGGALWIALLDLLGMVTAATAIRVNVAAGNMPQGFCRLDVASTENRPDQQVIGQLTRINATLAHVNRDLRGCVKLAA